MRLRTIFALALAIALATQCSSPAGTTQSKSPTRAPNILLLLADDLRIDALGAFGGQAVHTPNLDALAGRGVRFTGVHCMGSRHGAVCQPSRAMLLSGRPLAAVKDDLSGATTLPEFLRERGYRTFMTGKWHNGDASLMRAFPDGSSVFRGGMCDHFHVPLCDVRDGALVHERVGDRHSSELFADAAIAFVRERAAARSAGDAGPWFAYVAFTAPHDPRDPPPQWRERLDRDLPAPALPRNFRGQHGLNLGPETMTVRDENLLGWPRDPELLREQLRDYRALVAHLDEQVGRILAELEATGLADDTLIAFSSDHGLALGSHGLLGKQSLYEHSMATPLILAGAGLPRGATRDGLAYLLDLPATLLDAADGGAPQAGFARSLLPLARGADTGREELYLAFADSQRALLSERHKLIRLPQIDRTLGFDLADDPDELQPEALSPDERERLATRLRHWERTIGTDLDWTAAVQLLPTIDLTGQRFPPDRWQPAWIVEKYFPAPAR